METCQARIADVGCGHGGLDTIYADLAMCCFSRGWVLSDIGLLIICGDFQAVRNELDLNCMSVPRKYRHLGDFYKYYSQESRAPVLTLVIGGNHEASNYLFELYHGGWLAPNIYYLGAAGVIRYGPWRIAGLSGIYDKRYYHKPRHERLPYDREKIKSIYHIREYDVQKLLSITGDVDIALSHDWPAWVELFGGHSSLYSTKPAFYGSAKKDGLGSKPATQLLDHLRPSHWFSGHMHVRFPATVHHREVRIEDTVRQLPVTNEVRSALPVFASKYTATTGATAAVAQRSRLGTTNFLALGKVGQSHAGYLGLLEIEPPESSSDGQQYLQRDADNRYSLYYDEEWLAVTRANNESLCLADPNTLVVPPAGPKQKPVSAWTLDVCKAWVREHITKRELLKIPRNFTAHAPTYSPDVADKGEQPVEYPNVQTAAFARLLQMENKFDVSAEPKFSEDGGLNIEFG